MSHNAKIAEKSSIDLIIFFWFDPRFPYTWWFVPSPELDAEITTKFGNLVSFACTTTSLDHWAESPPGCLALILLLDQFPRNIFRKSADAYSSDSKALRIATRAISQGLDRRVPLVQQAFYYLPFEHDENLLSQIACVSFFEGFVGRCGAGTQEKGLADKFKDYAIRHKQVILDFDRFPGRNAVLHRQSTEEEIQFLKTHPQGF